MHIGIDARFLGAATSHGIAQYSESLLQALSHQDTENQYTVFVNAGLKRRLKLGKNFRLVRVQGSPLSLAGLLRFWNALRRERPDILHVHFPLAPIGFDCPTIITVHDVVPFLEPASRGGGMRFWDRLGRLFLYPRSMRRSRWVLCVSEATRNRLVEIYPEAFHKTIVRASGVEDIYRRDIEPATLDLIRSRLDAPEKYLIYAGSLGEDKNLKMMVEAFAKLRAADPRAADLSFVLDIPGDPQGIFKLRAWVRECGVEPHVKIYTGLGADERRGLFEGASVHFIVSKEEGFGLPVLKAQTVNVPVLAADSGALPEVCGEGALLVDPDDLDQITEALASVLFDLDLREDLIEKGRANAARYSWDDTAKHMRQIYELLF